MKCSLKPYYQRKEINKEEYKNIMRKAVPKVTFGDPPKLRDVNLVVESVV